MAENDDRCVLADHCRKQAEWCERLGSPLYAELLRHAGTDVLAGGPLWLILQDRATDPEEYYPALRVMGAVHRLVLTGHAPDLAAHYPSAGGRPGTGVWDVFRRTVEERADEIRAHLDRPPQTNEVARSASLLGGFLLIVRDSPGPLRLLEIGASAGLNLLWDHYRYESGHWSWGDPASPLRFEDVFGESATMPPRANVRVVERSGCDLAPVDPRSHEGRLTLLSYIWPDQLTRLERLRAALDVAENVDVRVERSDAVDWLDRRLAEPVPGTTTVVFHSIMIGYLPEDRRRLFIDTIDAAGRRATDDAPLAWLSLERAADRFEVRLHTWPAGEARLLAISNPHGPPVTWIDSSAVGAR